MKNVLRDLISRFNKRELPNIMPRSVRFPVVEGKATVLTGMRRSGKTYRCYQRMLELLAEGVERNRLLYLNFEDERLRFFKVDDFQLVLDIYYEIFPDNRNRLCYFFLDEIQNVTDWELFIRRVLDSEKIQMAITGSSSKLLTKEIATAMRGRSISTEIFPFSFEEYLRYHKIFETLPDYFDDADRPKVKHALNHYFRWGGFPEIQKTEEAERDIVLQEYFNAVVSQDIAERHAVGNKDALRFTASYLFNAIAERSSTAGILNTLEQAGIKSDWDAVKKYIQYYCDAFVFYPVQLHTRSFSQQKRNPTKYYAADIGLIRALSLNPDGDRGHLLENLVFLHLRRNGWQLEYVITRSGNKEIDFHAHHRTSGRKMLVQASYTLASPSTLERESSAIIKAAEYLDIPERLIVTWDEECELEGEIKVIPLWKFLLDRH